MTNIDFYKKLSEILENFKSRSFNEATAVKEITALNVAAKAAKLELEADISILEGIKNEIADEEYYDDESYDSYEESYDESY